MSIEKEIDAGVRDILSIPLHNQVVLVYPTKFLMIQEDCPWSTLTLDDTLA